MFLVFQSIASIWQLAKDAFNHFRIQISLRQSFEGLLNVTKYVSFSPIFKAT